jgi:hypothetical protein
VKVASWSPTTMRCTGAQFPLGIVCTSVAFGLPGHREPVADAAELSP